MSQTSTASSPSNARSHFAAGAKLSGDLTVPGLFELLGHADGKITADTILIEESGSAVGELRADTIVIKGRFEGQVIGRAVTLNASAQLSGEISYVTLKIDSGADVNCTCSRQDPSET